VTKMNFSPITPTPHPDVKQASAAHTKTGNPSKNTNGDAVRRAASAVTGVGKEALVKRLTGRS
jgi:hypothetical protein